MNGCSVHATNTETDTDQCDIQNRILQGAANFSYHPNAFEMFLDGVVETVLGINQ